ncbi:FkbM family methyltransferase [Telmatocola sphagniphila]|uniref:FkbM family methyltransferase n=1 Tax=Telmatocola sphagniphila TaxID=1123043 RepID=A0A8E6BCA2_9BACT|nr:FkbM family methyltransferase [Telmatocola sphagniphila]QVL34250.1 FkbM family methyltransferase [Telmatocola sphagniphila]
MPEEEPKKEDSLLRWRRRLLPLLDSTGLRTLSRKIFHKWVRFRYGPDRLVKAHQNDRIWKLDLDVALRGGNEEFETIHWFRKVVKPGDTVIDVGANVGQMTLELAHLVGPTGRVYSIEPGEGNLALLRKHIRANGFEDRVIVIPAACAAVHGGTITFNIFGEDAKAVGSGFTISEAAVEEHVRHGEKHLTVTVPTISLDGFIAEKGIRPQVVKIDVEGAEREVFQGASRLLSEIRPQIRFGFHPFAFSDPVSVDQELRKLFAGNRYEFDSRPPAVLELEEYNICPKTS